MTYQANITPNQQLILENREELTRITLTNYSNGGQQSQTCGLNIGIWTTIPTLYRLGSRVVIKIQTKQGDKYLQLQGTQLSNLSTLPPLDMAETISLENISQSSDIPPTKPMQMGNMSMSFEPMEMRMGDMSLKMGERPRMAPRFCTQCGTPIQSGVRFCGVCGHQIQ